MKTAISIKGLKPQTAFGVPEYFVQGTGFAPRNCWSALTAYRLAVGLGMDADEAFKQVYQAMLEIDPEALKRAIAKTPNYSNVPETEGFRMESLKSSLTQGA